MKPNSRSHLSAVLLLVIACTSTSQAQTDIGASWSYPTADKGANPGFQGKIVQARKNAGLTATIARGNAHLNGTLLEGNTEMPYPNLAIDSANPAATNGNWTGSTPVDVGGSFVLDGVVNFSGDGGGNPLQDGNFSDFEGDFADAFFPGLPGGDNDTFEPIDNGQNFSIELLTYLELPAGETTLGIYHDDAMELALHPNNARDLFRQQIVGFDSNSGNTDRTVTVNVAEAGLYSARILMAQWNGNASLEFYSVNEDESLTLVNDSSDANSINAWQTITSTARPYVTSVIPSLNETGVAKDTSISVSLRNVSASDPVMKVNGETATITKAIEGDITTYTHMPAAAFESGQTVSVELTYGEATSTWSFVTLSGRKAILITGGGQLNGADGWVAGRLASKFGLDITVRGDDTVTAEDAAGAALIYNSSTVNSSKVAGNGIQDLAIPIVNVEAGNVDDFYLADAPFSWGNGASVNAVEITQEDHPINAGLPPGEQIFNTKNVQYHWGIAPLESVIIGHAPGNEDQATIYAIEAGAEMLDESGEEVVFTHPARRVFFGVTGNDGADTYTEVGMKLFDAAITWALAEPSTGGGVPAVKDITLVDSVSVSFTTSSPDSDHVLQRSTDLQNWQIDSGATLTQDGDVFNFSAAFNAVPNEQFRVGILGPPALFTEDFESGAEGWTVKQVAGTTAWELGTPAVDAVSAAHSGANAYGTDLDGDYTDGVNATLTSPSIDLTEARRARLGFWYVVDTDEGTEGVQLQFITESGDILETFDTIFSGQSDGWTREEIRLSSDIVGQKIKLLFTFLTDPDEPHGAGFYLDDVEVND